VRIRRVIKINLATVGEKEKGVEDFSSTPRNCF
jgi:hypothetical protein